MARIDELVRELVRRGASDLHLAVGYPIKMRIDGDLEVVKPRPLVAEALEGLLRELCSPDQWERFGQHKDLDFAYEVEGVARLRVSYLQTGTGVAAVFRTIPPKVPSVDELGLPEHVTALAEATHGLVLVTGATGSGKSSTLAALIDRINRRSARHIILLEDPIEFVHQDRRSVIVQREIHTHAPSFACGLRAAVRADPDVILVGELRDSETMSLALEAAEMGFLVFGTLHTGGAARTIDRIVDMFPTARQTAARLALAGSLTAVVSQHLLRRADGAGRVAVHEVMQANPAIRNLIRGGETSKVQSAIQTGRGQGMRTMDMALAEAVRSRSVAPETALAAASDKQNFKRLLK